MAGPVGEKDGGRVSRHFSPIWNGITAVSSPRPTITRDLRTSPPICMATDSTMWRRPPDAVDEADGRPSDAILAVFGSIRTPTVRTTVPRAQNRPLNWTFLCGGAGLGIEPVSFPRVRRQLNAADLRRKHFDGHCHVCLKIYSGAVDVGAMAIGSVLGRLVFQAGSVERGSLTPDPRKPLILFRFAIGSR